MGDPAGLLLLFLSNHCPTSSDLPGSPSVQPSSLNNWASAREVKIAWQRRAAGGCGVHCGPAATVPGGRKSEAAHRQPLALQLSPLPAALTRLMHSSRKSQSTLELGRTAPVWGARGQQGQVTGSKWDLR